MANVKTALMTAMLTMMVAGSAMAAPALGYDEHVNIPKVTNWRVSNYDKSLPMSNAVVNVPKVTALEAKTDGYCHEYIIQGVPGTESEVVLATPNLPGQTITSEMLDEMMRGN